MRRAPGRGPLKAPRPDAITIAGRRPVRAIGPTEDPGLEAPSIAARRLRPHRPRREATLLGPGPRGATGAGVAAPRAIAPHQRAAISLRRARRVAGPTRDRLPGPPRRTPPAGSTRQHGFYCAPRATALDPPVRGRVPHAYSVPRVPGRATGDIKNEKRRRQERPHERDHPQSIKRPLLRRPGRGWRRPRLGPASRRRLEWVDALVQVLNASPRTGLGLSRRRWDRLMRWRRRRPPWIWRLRGDEWLRDAWERRSTPRLMWDSNSCREPL